MRWGGEQLKGVVEDSIEGSGECGEAMDESKAGAGLLIIVVVKQPDSTTVKNARRFLTRKTMCKKGNNTNNKQVVIIVRNIFGVQSQLPYLNW